MKKHYIARGIKYGVFMLGFIIFGSLAVKLLWNWLMPDLIGASMITWLQALGLMALSRLLFGGRGGRGRRGGGKHKGMGHSKWKQRWAERMEKMTPEEKERFRQKFQGRCGNCEWPWKETVAEAGKESGDPFMGSDDTPAGDVKIS